MTFLSVERASLESALPGFDKVLADLGMAAVEQRETGVLTLFREAGGGNLLIPRDAGGLGHDCLQAVRVTRALGSRAPSLAVGSTMHQYKVGWFAYGLSEPLSPSSALLAMVARERILIASCGAEGTDKGLFNPGVQVSPVADGLRVSGTKRPCSLTSSMGLLSMLIAMPAGCAHGGQLVNVYVRADAVGVSIRPLWGNPVLAAAETDTVVLDDVHVPADQIIPVGLPTEAGPALRSNFVWFEVLITAAYLGVASGLVEMMILRERGAPADRTAAAAELETIMAAVESLAREVDERRIDEALLARCLLVRYTAQAAIRRATDRALEAIGGMSFVRDGETAALHTAARALAFHPPSEFDMQEPLAAWLRDGSISLI